ncbi:hypothetical protein BD309DRAFT_985064 [Dichomitus squalens]|nr:hypothetical protein BD309DRAFT_985064 [Dichomitus squalens]
MKLSSDQNGDPLELENWIQSVQAAVKTGCTATSDIKKDVISSAISLRVFPSLLQGRATSYSALRDADASANSNAKAHESLPSWMIVKLPSSSKETSLGVCDMFKTQKGDGDELLPPEIHIQGSTGASRKTVDVRGSWTVVVERDVEYCGSERKGVDGNIPPVATNSGDRNKIIDMDVPGGGRAALIGERQQTWNVEEDQPQNFGWEVIRCTYMKRF